MTKKLNEIQIEAIYDLENSIVLKAGAGAGKTTVLTSRLIEIFRKTPPTTKVLAITFTRKASEEMRSRIYQSLSKERHLLERLEETKIQTIDSFCADLVRNFALELNISPDFKVMEEGQSLRLLDKICKSKVREFYKSSLLFQELLEKWDMDFYQIEETLSSLFVHLRQNGHLLSFKAYDHSLKEEVKENLLEEVRQSLLFFAEKYKDKDNDFQKLLMEKRAEEFFAEKVSVEEVLPFLDTIEKALSPIRYAKDKKKVFVEAKKALDQEKESSNLPYIELIASILRKIHKEFWEEKRKKEYMDFADLLEQALLLCKNPSLEKEIQKLFDYILVDEFQDTNALQISLVESISKEANLFLVGDRKQSIYGFRGSNLSASMGATKRLHAKGGKVLSMEDNYRSKAQLMDYINDIFREKIQNYEELKGHGKVDIGEFGLVNLMQEKSSPEEAIEREAAFIAQKVKAFLIENSKISMALLLRTKSKMEIYEKVFRQQGIPFINKSSKGFFETREIKDLMLLLQQIYNPWDPISHIGYLKSPFVGLKDGAIYKILNNKREDLREEDKEKERRGRSLLESCQKEAGARTLESLIYKIFYQESYLTYVGQSKAGQQGVQNLLKFLEITQEYDKEHARGLGGFLEYLKNKRKYEQISQADLPTESSYLEITTIHKSKGLEYDVVFLGDLSSTGKSISGKVNFTKEFGAGINLEGSSYIFDKNVEIEKALEEEENIRLLYVAMTRAKSALYILQSTEKRKGFLSYLPDHLPYLENCSLEIKENKKKKQGKIKNKSMPKFTFQKEKPTYSPSSLLEEEKGKEIGEKEDSNSKADLLGILFHTYATYGLNANEKLKEEILDQSNELSKKEKDRLRELMDKYDRSLGEKILATEVPFLVEFETFKLQGSFDQIREIDGKIHLIDLKTGRAGAKTKSLEKYKKQIQLYGLSWKKIHGNFPILELFFIEDGIRIKVEPMEEKEVLKGLFL